MALLNTKERILRLDRIGRLDRRITLIKPNIAGSSDSNEDYRSGWIELPANPVVWARKEDLRGKEVVIADKVQFMYLTVWTIRYREDVKANMRLVDEAGQVYEIITISDGEGRRKWLDVVTNILENEQWS